MIFPILFGLLIVAFLLLKLPLSQISLSDTNVYISMADHILHGKLLYKDMFLTNLPFFPYLSVLYLSLTRFHLAFFYSTVLVEAILTAILIYLSISIHKGPRSTPLIAAASYLFSMVVLATTDHQTGIFFASLMAMTAYYAYHKKKYSGAGIALGLMFVTKGYMLPVIIAFFAYDVYQRKHKSWNLIIPTVITVFVVLLPSLLFASSAIVSNIFGYTLHRPAGLDKINIFMFFITNQWLFCIALVFAWIHAKKKPLIALILAGGVAFLLLYQDIYFFYLNMLVPFMCLALADGISVLTNKIGRLNGLIIASCLVAVSMILNIKTYTESLSQIGKIRDIQSIVNSVQQAHAEYVFGAVELTPAVSFLSGIPLLDDIIDTNESLFVRHVYDLVSIKKHLYTSRTVVITMGIDRDAILPNGQITHLAYPVIPEIYKPLELEKRCTKLLSQPIVAEGATNRINVWKCYK
jgi:hypothetical protein